VTLTNFFQRQKFYKKIIHDFFNCRAKYVINQFEKYLNKKDLILDIGCDKGNISALLKEKNYDVTSLDLRNSIIVKKVEPIICNGEKTSFKNNKFDVVLLVYVLHHSANPLDLIKEAKRISKRIIIIEDIFYSNKIYNSFVLLRDDLFNFKFAGNSHNNKNDQEWKDSFKRLGLNLRDTNYFKSFMVPRIRKVVYYLEK